MQQVMTHRATFAGCTSSVQPRNPTGSILPAGNARFCPVRRTMGVPSCRQGVVRAMLPGGERLLAEAASSAPSFLDDLAARLTVTMLTLADAAPAVANAVSDPAVQEQAQNKNGGFFGPLAGAFEAFLKVLDAGLDKMGVPYSYGFSIILLTILVKVATFPLTKKQVESTMSMQQLQPRVKEIQNKYKNNQEKMQLEVGRLYKEAGVNPLAGCLPTLATLPVWIGLYRALSNVADEGLLTEGFFWIPSLAGPSSLAARNAGGGFSWLFPFVNGAPPIGWHDALAYLVLPVLLVVSQSATQKLMQPAQTSDDPAQQQSQAILKFLPLMIGYFSLNVPSGLTLYWFTNNLLSAAQQIFLKNSYKPALASNGASATLTPTPRQTQEEEERGPTGKEVGARKKKKQQQPQVIDVEAEDVTPPTQSRGSRKGEKFRAIKAREAAAKAARAAQQQGQTQTQPTATLTAEKAEGEKKEEPQPAGEDGNGK